MLLLFYSNPLPPLAFKVLILSAPVIIGFARFIKFCLDSNVKDALCAYSLLHNKLTIQSEFTHSSPPNYATSLISKLIISKKKTLNGTPFLCMK